jgi:three-Cys-motif partner protein
LNTSDPPFTHLRFFELDNNAGRLRKALEAEYSGRNLIVYPGDSNDTIRDALAQLRADGLGWAPTFAFIDPNGPHYTWGTLKTLASHKNQSAKTKVELWMLFPGPLFARLLPRTGMLRPDDDDAITNMFGTRDWHAIWLAKLNGEITPAVAKDEYVNLMRWRLEQRLGYKWTHQLELRNESNRPIYHLIFATDSEPGHKIMSHLYDRAAEEFPEMAAQARANRARVARHASGQFDLFESSGIEEPAPPQAKHGSAKGRLYVHEPPEAPRAHGEGGCVYCDQADD